MKEAMTQNGIERDLGAQPLDAILAAQCLANHDLVAASIEPMTHKAVQRARKGRRLTKHMQQRVTTALNIALKALGKDVERPWTVRDLFTY